VLQIGRSVVRFLPTDGCRKCDRTDTLGHRLVECGKRGTNMNMDKTASSLDTTDISGADNQRLESTSSFHTVAPKTATCSVVGVGQSSHIPNPKATGTDVTRLHRLHEAVEVEAVSVA